MWKKLAVCVIIVLCLSGCGQNREPAQKALDLRTALLETGGCTFLADIQADYGDRLYTFTVSCDYTSGKNAGIEVLQPKEIAGIAATVSDSGAAVEFDGMALNFGTMAGGRVSAMEAAWLLCSCWNGAYISAAGSDGDLLRVTYLDGFDEEELIVDTWLDASGTPVHGEVTHDGQRCLVLDISQFQLKG